MASVRSAIENAFEELGVTYDNTILDKCVDLCIEHGVEDADELVDSWMAYSVSHLQGDNPTPQHLARFEREVLAKKPKRMDKCGNDSTLKISDLDTSDIMYAYHQTPQRKALTPESSCINRGRLASPRGAFSPASFSPTLGTPSSKYTGRKNAGTVICERVPASETPPWNGAVTVRKMESGVPLGQKYMAFHLSDCAEAVDSHMARLVEQLSKRVLLEEILPVSTKHPTNLAVVGRVTCDADGKLNAESLLLEASPDNGGEVVRLDLSPIPAYSVFPGQVVAVEGLNVSGQKMVGRTLSGDASVPTPPPPLQLPGAIKVVVACGPFTPTDSLTYQPLIDLMEVVVREEPHLLLLTGPLLDAEHPAVRGGLIAETYQDMFDRLLDQIMQPLAELRTEVVLVSSYRESHGPMVFPSIPAPARPHPKLTVVSDPSLFEVEGIVIAATSIDVLMHIGKEEVAFPQHSGDRLARLASYVLQQQSFYPLRPPAPGVPLDPSLEACLELPVVPHLLVLPSDLRCFIKDINGCTVVNPEHLAKGLVGGNYAKLTIESTGVFGKVIKV